MKTFLKSASNLLRRILCDESGGAILEWALIAGLVVVVAVATIAAFGTKVLARWTSVNGSM